MFGDMAKKTRALVGSKPFTLSSDLTGLATMLSAFAGTWEDGKKRSQQKIKTLMKPQVAAIEEIMDAESLGAMVDFPDAVLDELDGIYISTLRDHIDHLGSSRTFSSDEEPQARIWSNQMSIYRDAVKKLFDGAALPEEDGNTASKELRAFVRMYPRASDKAYVLLTGQPNKGETMLPLLTRSAIMDIASSFVKVSEGVNEVSLFGRVLESRLQRLKRRSFDGSSLSRTRLSSARRRRQ